MPPTGESTDVIPRGLIIVFIIVVIAIVASGIYFYQSQEHQIKDKVTSDLTLISTLKADQISAWREDRLFDARVISAGPFFKNGADHYLTNGDDESRENILIRFREMNESLHYDNVMLVDPQGNVRLSLDPTITSIQPSVKARVNESLNSGTVTLTDFQQMPGSDREYLNVIAPLLLKTNGSEKPVGAVLLSIDPADFLYPLVQSWPVASGSAETLLVQREGDHVLFLNELRHQNNTALNLTIPLSQTDVPAVMAVLGMTGVFSGKDYRGIDVISVLEPVSGSPWFMVAKVDTVEAYSSWRSRSVFIIVMVAGTLVGAFIIIGLIWQRRQKSYYRSLYTAEAERREEEQQNRERLETLLRLSEMGSASEQELMDFVLDAGCRLTNSSLAFIGVMSPDESVFDITAWSKSAMKDCSVSASPIHYPIDKAGIWAEAVRKRKPLIVNDYTVPRTGKKGLPPGHVPITRFVSVPIFDGQRIVMVCAVANKETDYATTDVDNLTLLMQGVWNHLRKRSLDGALLQRTSDLEAAYEEITASEEELAANYDELEKSQKALAESERKYRNLYQFAQVGLFETSLKDATVVACNQRYCDLFGFPSIEDAIGKDVLGLYASPDERTEVSRILRERGLIENHTVKFRNQINKKIFWGQFSARYNYERDVAEGSIIDITAQKDAENKIRENEEQLLMAQDIGHTGSWEYNLLTGKIRGSAEGARIYGLASGAGDFPIDQIEACIPERERVHQALVDLIHDGKEYNLEFAINPADGSPQKVIVSIARLEKDARGNPARVVGVIQDITERKRAEEERERIRSWQTGVNRILESVLAPAPLEEKLKIITDGVVEIFGADFCRIWLIDKGDRCSTGCMHAEVEKGPHVCRFRDKCLHLKASSGRYTHIDGKAHARVPFGAYKIGRIASGEETKFLTNDVEHDPRVHDHAWAHSLGLVAFSGYQLKPHDGDVLGVFALFARFSISTDMDAILEGLSRAISLAIQKEIVDKALHESEQKFRTMIDWTYDWEYWISPTMDFIYVSPSVERITGYSPNEFVADKKLIDRIVHPEDRALWEEHVTHHADTSHLGKSGQTEFRIIRKDGDILWIGHICRSIYADDGTWIGTRISNRDITNRKVAEDALRQSEEKYRVLFTRMIEGSALHEMVYDPSGNPVDYRIIDVNPAFESTLGIRREEIIGKTSREAYGVDAPPYFDIYARVATTGQPEWFEVYFAPMKKHFAISAYSTRKGRFATIFEDITDRKEAEELREHLIQELEQKNAELERFTYTVSHDLKSPLITIKGFAGLIEDDAQKGDPVQLKKDVNRITTAADTMQELLADVLELSRIGRVVSPPEKTSFSTITHEAVELLAGPLAKRGVTVSIAPDLPLVNVDHARIREVVVNLIENAVKFLGTQEEPVIRIGVEMQETTPVFFVQDNGIGIDPRYLERIFNLFERLDVSTHGTGIGLTIVRRIIEVHGGKIWAESEGAGKGTTFKFTLPGVPEGEVRP